MDWRAREDSEAFAHENSSKTNRTLIGDPERILKHFLIRIELNIKRANFKKCPAATVHRNGIGGAHTWSICYFPLGFFGCRQPPYFRPGGEGGPTATYSHNLI